LYREYHSTQGRWVSPDPAGLAAVDPSNPQSWNRYAYVTNNPLALTDPLGLGDCGGNQNYDCNEPDPCAGTAWESNASCHGPGDGGDNWWGGGGTADGGQTGGGGSTGGVWGQNPPGPDNCNDDPTGCYPPPTDWYPLLLLAPTPLFALGQAHAQQTAPQQQKPWCEDVFVNQFVQHAISPIPDISNIGKLGGEYGYYYISKWFIVRQALKVSASATGAVASQRIGVAAASSFWVGVAVWGDISLGEALWDEVSAIRNGQCQ